MLNESFGLTDEEDAEYRSFESLIATNVKFNKSMVMLCIFHAIWQPFKCDIYPLCPKKSKRGQVTSYSRDCCHLISIALISNHDGCEFNGGDGGK